MRTALKAYASFENSSLSYASVGMVGGVMVKPNPGAQI
jgi:hypothetical protein